MSIVIKRYIPIALTSVIALVLLAEFFFVYSPIDNLGKMLKGWGTLVAAFALFLGMAQISRLHVKHILRRDKEWIVSVWLLGIMVAFFFGGIILGVGNPVYMDWYFVIAKGVGTTTNAILAFYIFSAGYRVLRVKNLDSTAFMVAAIFCMLFSAPIGEVIHPILPKIGSWFVDVPNSAATVGLLLGIAIGTIALGVRTILGLELGYIGITGEED